MFADVPTVVVVACTCVVGVVDTAEVEDVVVGGKKPLMPWYGGGVWPVPRRQPSMSPSSTIVAPAPDRENANAELVEGARKYIQLRECASHTKQVWSVGQPIVTPPTSSAHTAAPIPLKPRMLGLKPASCNASIPLTVPWNVIPTLRTVPLPRSTTTPACFVADAAVAGASLAIPVASIVANAVTTMKMHTTRDLSFSGFPAEPC